MFSLVILRETNSVEQESATSLLPVFANKVFIDYDTTHLFINHL